MQPSIPTPPMPQTAPAAAPATSPIYNPPPAPATSAPMMEDGGSVGSSSGGNKFKEFFSDVNILDVVISSFIVGGVLYTIHYYKFMMMMEKTGYADLSSRIQKIESQMAAAKKKAEVNASGNNTPAMRRKRALMTL
jgi:hypothetical protein